MKPEDRGKLLGGYAAGILTPAEREALLTAALEDQDLFEALMREEPLRQALEQPELRARLLAELKAEGAIDIRSRYPRQSWWRRPLPLAGALAVLVLTIGIQRSLHRPSTVRQIAVLRSQPAIRLEAAPEKTLSHNEALAPAPGKDRAINRPPAPQRKEQFQSKLLTAESGSPPVTRPNGQPAANDTAHEVRPQGMVGGVVGGVPGAFPAQARVEPAPFPPAAQKIEELPFQSAQQAEGKGSANPVRQPTAPNVVLTVPPTAQAGRPQGMLGGFAGSAGGGRLAVEMGNVQERATQSLAKPEVTLSAPLQISTLRGTDRGNFAAATEFHGGDKIRFAVLAKHAGSLTVSRQDAEGNWIVLYSSVPVSAARTVLLPETGTLTLERDTRFRFQLMPPDIPAQAQELSLTVK